LAASIRQRLGASSSRLELRMFLASHHDDA
jgi:hypothetical protein